MQLPTMAAVNLENFNCCCYKVVDYVPKELYSLRIYTILALSTFLNA